MDEKKQILKELTCALKDISGKTRNGYLPIQYIKMLAALGSIRSSEGILPEQFQPVSLDLRLGAKAYRIQSSFLSENENVEEKLKELKLYEVDLSEEGILEREAIYLIPLLEELVLPEWIKGYTNPKSSTGRLDMFTRVIVDKSHRFDEIPSGYQGKLYLEVIPRSFLVKVKKGLSLNQLRLYQGDPFIKDDKLKVLYKNQPLLFNKEGFPIIWDQVKSEDGVFISVDVAGNGGKDPIVAYKAKANSSVVDLTKGKVHRASDFWEEVRPIRNNKLILEPESFYIMMSREKICVWPEILAEMIAYEPSSGELRTHYAGFFDPGFGWNGSYENLKQGTRAVMEVRPHDVPFMVEDGQTFCRLLFENIIATPEKVYGKDINSHYHSQGLTLSKYFKS